MLTVSDALELDIFQGAEVVAGRGGLTRRVEWVHNVGVPDAADWLNGGELVLTTAINLPPTPADQQAYLHAMIAKGVAGVCLAVGRYVPSIPDYLCAVADAHDFPLIAIPYQTRFVDVARVINQLIAQRDVKRALAIQQALTQLVLDGGELPDLAATLARLVGQSVSIENEQFEAFASHNIADVDEARRYTQQYGRTDPRLVQALEAEVLPEIRRTLRPVQIPQMPEVGLELERILAPIVVHGALYGYVWIIADGRPLSELERMAIESGATIAALMLLRQEAVQREEASQREDLLTRLMQDDAAARADQLS
ncbi:MAG: PucR family transcriptional regulator ligand-binding domain-containing protein, partial [Armatimonadetes bacterium]|nr:PucR family transcriptional regulator ligand-binding domain-containing protein [Anaerolineae bacterium]